MRRNIMDKYSTIDEQVRLIAGQELFIRDLEPAGRDALDFHDIHVSAAKRALEKAFIAGYRAAQEGEMAPLTANEIEAINEYLCEGNSKEDLAQQLIEMLPLKELGEILKHMNEWEA